MQNVRQHDLTQKRRKEDSVTPADLVLRGGKIATLDPELGEAEAVAVTGHAITAVGSDEEIAAYLGPDTEVIELDGRLAVPGFIEGHGHYMSLWPGEADPRPQQCRQLGRGGGHRGLSRR